MDTKKRNIKICVSATGDTLNSEVDPRFGRCEYFLIVDIQEGKILSVKAIKNIGTTQDRGAGTSAAEQVGELGVEILITGNIGPKADNVLSQLGIEVYKSTGIVKKVINEYLNNSKISIDNDVVLPDAKSKSEDLKNQRIFIPLMDDNKEDSEVSLHFGHAPYLGLYDVSAKKLTIKKNNLNHSDPLKSPVDQIIKEVNPTIVFAHDMGLRAINLFKERGIILKTGEYKIVKEVIDNIDRLEDLTQDCGHN